MTDKQFEELRGRVCNIEKCILLLNAGIIDIIYGTEISETDDAFKTRDHWIDKIRKVES